MGTLYLGVDLHVANGVRGTGEMRGKEVERKGSRQRRADGSDDVTKNGNGIVTKCTYLMLLFNSRGRKVAGKEGRGVVVVSGAIVIGGCLGCRCAVGEVSERNAGGRAKVGDLGNVVHGVESKPGPL
jgi:hypothetical protein